MSFSVDVIVDQAPRAQLRQELEELCPGRIRFHVIDSTQFGDLLEVNHITKGMYYRLMIPELIEADSVLYLDCDVLIRGDLAGLLSVDLSSAYAAAVVNPFYDASRLGIEGEERYFNSGIMMINCRLWRRDGIKNQVLDYLRSNVDLLRMPDQDALNVVMRKNWVELHPTYNCQVSMLIRHGELQDELAPRWQTDFLSDPIIMHFSAGHKQWHSTNRIRYSREYRTLRTHTMETRKSRIHDYAIGLLRHIKMVRLEKNPYFY